MPAPDYRKDPNVKSGHIYLRNAGFLCPHFKLRRVESRDFSRGRNAEMQIHGVVRSILATKHEASGGCHERSEEGASRERSGAIPPLAELILFQIEEQA